MVRAFGHCFREGFGRQANVFRFPKRPWSKFITADNKKYVSEEALSFLDGLLRYDHQVPPPPRLPLYPCFHMSVASETYFRND